MYILVRLNPNQGINLGPNFTLTANVGTLVPATATLTQLLAGVSVLADDTVTQVTITSQGVCTNSLILSVVQATTTTTSTTSTTSTTTTTTTAAPIVCYNYFVYADDGTENRNSYNFSYVNCAGVLIERSLVNGSSTNVCAREDSIIGDPQIYADVVGLCGEITPIDFDITYTCNSFTNLATVEVSNFTGGSGSYKINNTLSLSSGATNSVSFVNVVTPPVSYFNVEDNTWYVQVRDQVDAAIFTIKSIVIECVVPGDCVCWRVDNPTEGSLTVDYYACDGTQPIIGVPGGSTDWICVIRGTTPIDVESGGLVITQCSPEVVCTVGNTNCNNCSNS